ILKDSDNKTLGQLEEHLKAQLDQIIEAVRLKLAQEGSEKLQKIRDTRPENINNYNEYWKKKYNERYYTMVFPNESKNEKGEIVRSWDIYTGVQGKKKTDACYQAQLLFEEGTFIRDKSYKSRLPIYSYEKFPFGEGGFDDEMEYNGTKPLSHSIIMF